MSHFAKEHKKIYPRDLYQGNREVSEFKIPCDIKSNFHATFSSDHSLVLKCEQKWQKNTNLQKST
jgi:hypothetical protein